MAKEHLSALEAQPCIGLFGTCGPTTFRQEKFIPVYEANNISYFNPQVPEGTWVAENALLEADHLAHDVIQCWPVTGETYGFGSLSEVGFSIASSLRAPTPLPKLIIPMIEMQLSPKLHHKFLREESERARILVQEKLNRSNAPIIQVRTLDEMVETSVTLFPAVATIVELMKSNNPAFKNFSKGRNAEVVFDQAIQQGQKKK